MPEALKDRYTTKLIRAIGTAVHQEYAVFAVAEFVKAVMDSDWEHRELKARMRHLTHCLHQQIPNHFPEAIPILNRASSRFDSGFLFMFFPDYVEVYGMEHPDEALQALAWMTRFSSSEFAIRPFLIRYPERTLAALQTWSEDENYHVRRLSSEGCRPLLPWAIALPAFKSNPAPILPILTRLRNDPSEYVRRSVANNLNDISKNQPELVGELLSQWKGETRETDRLCKHAARTLLKQGHTRTLRLFGFGNPESIRVQKFQAKPSVVPFGGITSLNITFEVAASQAQLLRIEYRVHFVKARGKKSPKMFQVTERSFLPRKHDIIKTHDFTERTTRKHYPGKHQIDLVINGETKATVTLTLKSD